MMRADYAGLNGFIWWVGVVEDRKDPLNSVDVKLESLVGTQQIR